MAAVPPDMVVSDAAMPLTVEKIVRGGVAPKFPSVNERDSWTGCCVPCGECVCDCGRCRGMCDTAQWHAAVTAAIHCFKLRLHCAVNILLQTGFETVQYVKSYVGVCGCVWVCGCSKKRRGKKTSQR